MAAAGCGARRLSSRPAASWLDVRLPRMFKLALLRSRIPEVQGDAIVVVRSRACSHRAIDAQRNNAQIALVIVVVFSNVLSCLSSGVVPMIDYLMCVIQTGNEPATVHIVVAVIVIFRGIGWMLQSS